MTDIKHRNVEEAAEDQRLRKQLEIAKEALLFYAKRNHVDPSEFRIGKLWVGDCDELPTVLNIASLVAQEKSGEDIIHEGRKTTLDPGKRARRALMEIEKAVRQ